MDTKVRWTPVRRRFSLPDPKLAPGTARSGKNPIRKTGINFKGASQIFLFDFPDRRGFSAPQNDPSRKAANRRLALIEAGRHERVLQDLEIAMRDPSVLEGPSARALLGWRGQSSNWFLLIAVLMHLGVSA